MTEIAKSCLLREVLVSCAFFAVPYTSGKFCPIGPARLVASGLLVAVALSLAAPLADAGVPGTVETALRITSGSAGFSGVLNPRDHFGGAVASIGDIDGDGIGDLAVGSPRDDDGAGNIDTDIGALWILFLQANGSVKSSYKIAKSTEALLSGVEGYDRFGYSVAAVGDLDGDGNTELAVGARGNGYGSNGRGAVYILFLQSDGHVKAVQKISDTAGDFPPRRLQASFGCSVAGLGDINGDGVPDVAVGEMRAGADGAVWIIFLTSAGKVAGQTMIGTESGGFQGAIGERNQFGAAITALGDIDGDGHTDIAVGQPFEFYAGNNVGGGAIWILLLNADGTVRGQRQQRWFQHPTSGDFTGFLEAGDGFGISVASLGDLDNDGFADLAVGAYGDDVSGVGDDIGAIWVLFLEPDGGVKSYVKTGAPSSSPTTSYSFAESLAGPATDGTSAYQLFAGAPPVDNGYRGAVWRLELGYAAVALCGDGEPEGAESCDDGNTINGDCCSSACQFESLGTTCATDGNGCTDDVCDGSGTCTHPNNTAACNDGLFCNGADSCAGGSCATHAGDPCSGSDCNTCQEAEDDCTDPATTACGDRGDTVCDNPDTCDGSGSCLVNNEPTTLECRADAGECDVAEHCDGEGACPADAYEPPTTLCTADDNPCTDDHCDGAGACTHAPNTLPCDDNDQCTVNDQCTDGVCTGDDVIVKPACRWVMMGGYGGSNPNRPKQVGGRIRENAVVTGDVCGDTERVGGNSVVAGDIVATRSICGGSAGVELGPKAGVQDTDNVIVTGGSRVIGKPQGVLLPGFPDEAVTAIECEHHVEPPSPPPAYYDTTGDDPLVAECDASRQALASYVTDLAAVACTAYITCGTIRAGETLFIGPGVVDPCISGEIVAGQINYICLDGTLIAYADSNIEIDDNGDTDTEYVFIISGATKLLLRSKITLVPPLDASRVLIYGKKKCYIGNEVQGAGTLVCPNSKLQVWTAVQWQGALLSGNGYVQVGDNSTVTHVPLLFSGQ